VPFIEWKQGDKTPCIVRPRHYLKALASRSRSRSRSYFTTDDQSVSQYVLVSSFFLSFCWNIALLFVLGRPLRREVGSVICSTICQWSESRRTHNRTLLFHLKLLGSLSVASYGSQRLRWQYSYPPPHGSAQASWEFRSPFGHEAAPSYCRWDKMADKYKLTRRFSFLV
jgi:hypothetical protein